MNTINLNENEVARRDAFDQILGQLEAGRQRLSRARVLGIAACRCGDGATSVMTKLARRLARNSRRGVLQADCADFILASRLAPNELLAQCSFTEEEGLWLLSSPDRDALYHSLAGSPEADLKTATSVLASLFDFVLLDCGPVNVSGRIWELAPVIDDVLLVVAAGETKREQVTYSQRIIAQSGAHLLGVVLNKRTYPLPQLIHRLLN